MTENAWRSASWLLFFPFMLYNLAHFALPAARDDPRDGEESGGLLRDRWHAGAAVLLRLLALAASVQFIAAVVAAFVGTVALQARHAHFPAWLAWYAQWTAAERIRVALGAVAIVLRRPVVDQHAYGQPLRGPDQPGCFPVA